MSTVRTNNILDASGGNTATINSMTPTADSLRGFRNRIINGDMRIDQRNAGASVTLTNDTVTYTIDRWYCLENTTASIAIQQSTTAPTTFKNSLLWTVNSTGTVSSGNYNIIVQPIEGFNVADLGFGASGASTITISFWVRCSVPATYGGAIRNSAQNRSYSFPFTINSANTWEQKTVTIAGDTSGTWLTNNGVGLDLIISLGSGSNFQSTANVWYAGNQHCPTGSASLVGTSGATFFITGVQLEVGSTATPFERRPYGTELMLCQRYYYKASGVGPFVNGYNMTTTTATGAIPFPVPLRTSPTALEQTGTAANYRIVHGATVTTCSAVPYFEDTNTFCGRVVFTVASGLTAGQGSMLYTASGTTAYLAWSAEL